jgi:hypothetical protein
MVVMMVFHVKANGAILNNIVIKKLNHLYFTTQSTGISQDVR